MLHKQEDTQAKEADPFVAETKPRGKWLGRFSGRLAAGWHPSVHVQMSLPYPSPCFSLYGWWLALFTCCCLWKPAGGSYLCLAGHMAFTGAHVASPHCGGMLDRSSSGERSALVHNSRKSFKVGRHGTRSSLVYDSSASMWHRPGNSSMGNGLATTTKRIPLWPYVKARVNKSRRLCKISEALGTNSWSRWDCRGHFALHSGQCGQYALASPSASETQSNT